MHSNLQMFSLLRKSDLMKHMLLSVSIFSLLLSYSSWRFLFNFHYFYSFPSQLFSYSSTKNFIFLLSNGILAFIVKNSGLLEKNGGDSPYVLMSSEAKVSLYLERDDHEELEDSVVIEEERGETASFDGRQTENGEPTAVLREVQEADSRLTIEEDEEENGYLFEEEEKEDDKEEEEEEEENGYLFEEEVEGGGGDGEGGGGGNGLLSTEELNRKFDEFIRRMKEEIRIEAQQHHLVMV